MKEDLLSRGSFFKKSAILAAGVSAAGLGVGFLRSNDAQAKSFDTTPWPWPYVTLDPEKARIIAHDSYWGGMACSAGALNGIIVQLEELLPDPYAGFPVKMMLFGHGGGVGWGTICGALNGSSALISLVLDKANSDKLIHELMGWYTQALFPSDISNEYGVNHVFNHQVNDMDLTQAICGSPLCHISVSTWCNDADISVGDAKRKERCARLAGDCAAKTVELLNAHFAGTFASEYIPPAAIAACGACHDGGAMVSNVAAKMNCTSCHGETPHTTSGIANNEQPVAFDVKQNYPNPLSDATSIEFAIYAASKVRLEVYNLAGQHIQTLIDNQNLQMGAHTAVWNGNDANGRKAVSGMYIYRLSVGSKVLSKTMIKL